MTEDDEIIQEFTALRRGMVIRRDAAGRPTSITVAKPLLIDQLLEREIIDDKQHWHARQLLVMRTVFLRPLAMGRHMEITAYSPSDDTTEPPKYPIEDNDYLKVLRDMRHRWQQEIVTEACDDNGDTVILNHLIAIPRQKVCDAFDAMSRAINRLIDKKEAAEEARKKMLALENDIWQYNNH
jgi:hypothetical protein